MPPFIDRSSELAALRARFARPSSFSLVYGQRRVGKTWLLRHLLQDHRGSAYFLADESTSRHLLARFLADLAAAGFLPTAAGIDDWGTALTFACQGAAVADRPLRLVLDECQYLFAAEPALPSILQRVWDEHRDRIALHLVLCGSALGTLARLGDVGQPLHGRFDLRLRLDPFSYREAALFAPSWCRAERFRLYGVFGGLARHLAEVDPDYSLAENACAAILAPLAPLHEAVPDLLRTEHLSSRPDADAVLAAIGQGETGFCAIASRAGLSQSRADYVLKELLALGLIVRVARAGDREGSRYARYRCADPFTGSWYRFVRPNRGALQGTPPEVIWQERIAPELENRMGPVFEQIALQAIAGGALGAEVGPVDAAAPWWSRDGHTELDLVVSAGTTRICCECKWRGGGRADLDALRQLRAHVERHPQLGGRGDVRLCLVSGGGFTPRVVQVADAEGVLLLGPEGLLP